MIRSAILLASLYCVAFAAPGISKDCERLSSEPPASTLYLEIIRLDGSAGTVLGENSTICPDEYPTGFSILCKGFQDGTRYATFFKNGAKLRRENHPPYAIAGNFGTRYVSFRGFSAGDSFTIKCVTDSNEETKTLAHFACEAAQRSTGLEPSTAGKPKDVDPTPVGTVAPTTKPAAEREPVTEVSPTPSTLKAPSSTPPPPGVTGPTPAAGPSPAMLPKGGCISVSALDAASNIPSEWTKRSNGLVFKQGGDGRIERPGGKFPVTYKVVAPADGTYAITMDSTTPHGSEHNDIYMRVLDGGLELRKGDKKRPLQNGWLKVYQNAKSRKISARTVDHQGFSLSTGKSFRKGDTITFEISGRSTRIFVHGFYLFPCSGTDCQEKSALWRDYVNNQCELLP